MRTGLKGFMLFVIGILVAMFGFPVSGYSSPMSPILEKSIYIVIFYGEEGFVEEQTQTEEKIKSYILKFDDSGWMVSYTYTEDPVNGNSFSVSMKTDKTTVFLGDIDCNGSVDTHMVFSDDPNFNGRGLDLLYFKYLNKLVYRYKESEKGK